MTRIRNLTSAGRGQKHSNNNISWKKKNQCSALGYSWAPEVMNLSSQCWRYSIWTLTWYKRLSFSFELPPKKFCIADAADLHQATLSVFAHGVWVVLHLNSAVLCKGKARGHLQPSLKWFHGPQDRMLDIVVIMMCVISNKDIFFTAVLTYQKDNQLFYCWFSWTEISSVHGWSAGPTLWCDGKRF